MFNIPITFFDLETTGVDPDVDRFVQFAAIKYMDGKPVRECSYPCNPEMRISPGAARVHGITDKMAAEYPTFPEMADCIYELLNNSVWAGYNNMAFDVPLLLNEFAYYGFTPPTPCGIIDGYKLFLNFMGPAGKGMRTLSAAHLHYCGREFEHAHDALCDVKATARIIEEMILLHDGTPESFMKVSETVNLNIDRRGFFRFSGKRYTPVCACGKYKDVKLEEVPLSYLEWISKNETFSPDTRMIARNALNGIIPQYRKIRYNRKALKECVHDFTC